MPMGATNSGFYFQMIMEEILDKLRGPELAVFQDDILIATEAEEQHIQILQKLFKTLQERGIKINIDKCNILRKKVIFLGHSIQEGLFTPDPANTDAIALLRPPSSKKSLREFLGKINYYARFIPGLSHTIAPLTSLLTGKGKTIEWGTDETLIFNEIKDQLCKQPILHYPNFNKEFIISVQVSNVALVGVIEQEDEHGRWPVGYYSRKLSSPEQNYSTLEKNALAIIAVIDHFEPIVYGHPVTILSDRKGVEYLRSMKDGNTRLSDWIVKMSKYTLNYKFDGNVKLRTNILKIGDMAEYQNKNDLAASSSVIEGDIPHAYTDGSCFDNGRDEARAGIGVHWVNTNIADISYRIMGKSTNNRAELVAAIVALKIGIAHGLKHIVIVTDSNYMVINVTENLDKWAKEGWLDNKRKPISNRDEFEKINELRSRIMVDWKHVKGHSSCTHNSVAHQLAYDGAKSVSNILDEKLHWEPEVSKLLIIKDNSRNELERVSISDIKQEQERDTECNTIKSQLEGGNRDLYKTTRGIRLYLNIDNIIMAQGSISLRKGIICEVDAIFIPRAMRRMILERIHRSEWNIHGSFIDTCKDLLSVYYWGNFRQDTFKFIQGCMECQKTSVPRKKIRIMEFDKPTMPNEMIALDILGPIITSSTGKRYILSIIDLFSRHLTLCGLANQEANTVTRAFEKQYVAIYGAPKRILSDRGSNFRSEHFNDLCKLLEIDHKYSSPYHPETNGLVERANKEIKKRLTFLCNKEGRKWSDTLHHVQFAHNNAHHHSLNTTPNNILFGRNLRFPIQSLSERDDDGTDDVRNHLVYHSNRLNHIRKDAHDHEKITREERNNRLNRNRVVPEYLEDESVLYKVVQRAKTKKGFNFVYDGSFKVSKKISPVSYDLSDCRNPRRIRTIRAHIGRMKSCITTGEVLDRTQSINVEKHDTPKMIESAVGENSTVMEDDTRQLTHTYINGSRLGKDTENNDPANTIRTCSAHGEQDKGDRYHTRSKGKVDHDIFTQYTFNRGNISKSKQDGVK